jgi:hypothetical protein
MSRGDGGDGFNDLMWVTHAICKVRLLVYYSCYATYTVTYSKTVRRPRRVSYATGTAHENKVRKIFLKYCPAKSKSGEKIGSNDAH